MLRFALLISFAVAAGLLATGCGRTCAQAPTDADPNALSLASRPADAVAHGGHWYMAFEEDVTWQQAKARCEKMGGYLACITSESEQAFLAELADGRYLYLGGTDEKQEGTWRWIDGSDWKYESWLPGQPNNWGGDENYLATYDGGDWVDVAAEGDGFWMPYGFVCEWDR